MKKLTDAQIDNGRAIAQRWLEKYGDDDFPANAVFIVALCTEALALRAELDTAKARIDELERERKGSVLVNALDYARLTSSCDQAHSAGANLGYDNARKDFEAELARKDELIKRLEALVEAHDAYLLVADDVAEIRLECVVTNPIPPELKEKFHESYERRAAARAAVDELREGVKS